MRLTLILLVLVAREVVGVVVVFTSETQFTDPVGDDAHVAAS